jgi:hypothetical protein
MFAKGKITPLGYVVPSTNIYRGDLWTYIYYLHRNNKKHPLLSKMSSKNSNASASLFVSVVKEAFGKKDNELIKRYELLAFINYIVEDKLYNPIADKMATVIDMNTDVNVIAIDKDTNTDLSQYIKVDIQR